MSERYPMGREKVKRSAFIRDGVGIVPLTQGYEAIVDADLVDYIGRYNWSALENHNTVYARRNLYDCNTKNAKIYAEMYQAQNILMHQQLLQHVDTIVPDGSITDHINRNGLDNRLENLRVVTVSENNRNSIRHKTPSSKYLGVSKSRRKTKLWRVDIQWQDSQKGKQRKCLGFFADEKEAGIIYMDYARWLGIYDYIPSHYKQLVEKDYL